MGPLPDRRGPRSQKEAKITTDPLTELLTGCNTPALFDVLRVQGLPVIELPRSISGIDPAMQIAGPVFTATGRPDPEITVAESLELFIRDILSGATPGHVVVVQPNDPVGRCYMGDLSAEALRQRGVRGYFVDGGCRDTQEICEIGFPVFCAYNSPLDIIGSWRLEATQVPVKFGDVTVSPGDYILGDRDGTLLIPAEHADFVIRQTHATMDTDSIMRTAIRAGRDPYDAYLEFGKL